MRGVLLVGHVADAEDAIDAGRVEERDGARDGGCIAVGALYRVEGRKELLTHDLGI